MKWLLTLVLSLLLLLPTGLSARTGYESIPIATELIAHWEQYRECAYLPTPNDRWTYGFGSTYRPDGEPVRRGDCISRMDAESLLASEIRHIEHLITTDASPVLLRREWRAGLSSFVYNVGFGAYSRSTLRRHLLNRNWNGVCVEIVKWDKQRGQTLRGLTRRRLAEASLMRCK